MRRLIRSPAISALLLLLLPTVGAGHDPITTKLTWTQEISRIVYKHCVSCHHDGGAAMSLVAYDEARPWAKAIRDEVLERRMPPWGPVKGFGAFRDDRSLTDPEIEMLTLWVEGGAPKGDDVYLPAPPKFPVLAGTSAAPRGIAVRGNLTLPRAITAIGIEPREMKPGEQMRIIARLPDGAVENLIWLRNTKNEWRRVFYFREPVALAKGTMVAVEGGAAVIVTGKPGS